ncbi:hypothetical protein [ANMV-1 virus]|nr:hypothetical protein [ANMV-1 virus]
MTEEKRNPVVNIAQLEEAFGVDLAEFKVGGTYSLLKLLDKLKLGNGTPKLHRGRPQKENIFEKEIAKAEEA